MLIAAAYDYGELYLESRYDIPTYTSLVLTFSDEVCIMPHTSSQSFLADNTCRLNISGSADTCSSRQHVPDEITEQTLDLGVNIVYSCVYRTSLKFVTTCRELSIVIGPLRWSLQLRVSV